MSCLLFIFPPAVLKRPPQLRFLITQARKQAGRQAPLRVSCSKIAFCFWLVVLEAEHYLFAEHTLYALPSALLSARPCLPASAYSIEGCLCSPFCPSWSHCLTAPVDCASANMPIDFAFLPCCLVPAVPTVLHFLLCFKVSLGLACASGCIYPICTLSGGKGDACMSRGVSIHLLLHTVLVYPSTLFFFTLPHCSSLPFHTFFFTLPHCSSLPFHSVLLYPSTLFFFNPLLLFPMAACCSVGGLVAAEKAAQRQCPGQGPRQGCPATQGHIYQSGGRRHHGHSQNSKHRRHRHPTQPGYAL